MPGIGNVIQGDVCSSAVDVQIATPSDSTEYNPGFRAIRSVGAGLIYVTTLNGGARKCNFLAGETRVIAGSRILATSTTVVGDIEVMF